MSTWSHQDLYRAFEHQVAARCDGLARGFHTNVRLHAHPYKLGASGIRSHFEQILAYAP